MQTPILAVVALGALVAACGERAREYQSEMSQEAASDPSAATTAVPQVAAPRPDPQVAPAPIDAIEGRESPSQGAPRP